MSFCSNCGTTASDGAKFCSSCGKPMAGNTGSTRRSSSAPPREPRGHNRGAQSAKAASIHVLYVASPVDSNLLDLARELAVDHKATTVTAKSPSPVQAKLRELDQAGATPDVVCLLGASSDLPHASFDDDTGNDYEVLTDNDYGMLDSPDDEERYSELALPDVPVCRIPTTDLATVGRMLSVRDGLASSWAGGVAVSCKVWQGASEAVKAAITHKGDCDLMLSPPSESDEIASQFGSGVGRVYFNVHGSDQVKYWVGEGGGGYVEALAPSDVELAKDAIFISEACYGARHDADSDGETISTAAINGGASAFVGSTIIAWGPVQAPIGLADIIVTGTYNGLDSGLSLPAALLYAKNQIVAEEGAPLSPQVLNTVSSFIAYGGPLSSVATGAAKSVIKKSSTGGTWSQVASKRSHVGRRDVLGRSRDSIRNGGTGVLGAARQRILIRINRLGFTPVAREVLSLHAIDSIFTRAGDIQAELQLALTGSEGDNVTSMRYKSRRGEQQAILATNSKSGQRYMWIVDRSGRIRGKFLSKSKGDL